jgi:hypothetical protein
LVESCPLSYESNNAPDKRDILGTMLLSVLSGQTVLRQGLRKGSLEVPWVLDVDVTIKQLYGKQEGAVLGYNPVKPGRPTSTVTVWLTDMCSKVVTRRYCWTAMPPERFVITSS